MEAHAIYSDIKQGNLASFEWFYKNTTQEPMSSVKRY